MQTGGQLPDGSHFYDIVRGGIGKGAGLADLCEKMGLSSPRPWRQATPPTMWGC